MWRLCKLGYRHEPGLIVAAFSLSLLSALPDALLGALVQAGLAMARSEATGGAASSPPVGARHLRHRHLVPDDGQHPGPASLSRQGHDRARVARRHACWHRSPRSRTRNGPTISTGSPCCAIRSSCSITCTCRSSRHADGSCGSASPCAAGVDSSGAGAAGAVRGCRRCSPRSWRPAVERTAYERGASSAAACAPPVRHRDHRDAGQGGARDRHRRTSGHCAPRRHGSAGNGPDGRGARWPRPPGTPWPGPFSAAPMSAPSCS